MTYQQKRNTVATSPLPAQDHSAPTCMHDKVVIITGAANGIGRAGAEAFAEAGANVIIADTADASDVVTKISGDGGPEARAYRIDVGDPESVAAMVADVEDAFGHVDVLYANAGVHDWGDAPETSVEVWERSLRVNLSGTFYLAKYGIPALRRSGGGSIITTASEYGVLGARRSVGYCASKAGVINLTRALAVDHAVDKIRANCIVPGPVATERGLAIFASDPGLSEKQDALVLLGRNGEPKEIANAALFLAGPQSTFITGAVLRVDGGSTAWYPV